MGSWSSEPARRRPPTTTTNCRTRPARPTWSPRVRRARTHVGPYNEYAWDFGLPANYEVSAAQGGQILVSDWSPYWQNGIEVIIRHSNGTCTHYAHLNRAIYNTGDWVPQGRVIGWSGSTGASTAPHLHFQVINCYTRVGIPATLQGWTPYTGSWPVSVNYYA
ncbi:M23 family metallopeptidase [Micromonospora sp. CPCC 206060]|uniref:M23 family metallopeptidase n=1 Tax=Micromonospora sp. CPCC 206060 TaxID=3122406 RepID=UPI002FEEC7CD